MNWLQKIAKEWEEKDWLQMVNEAFKVMDHSTGPYEQFGTMQFGTVSFINKAQNIRVILETYFFSKEDAIIVTVLRESNPSLYHVIKWPKNTPNYIKGLPYEIVTSVYHMIDHPEQYGEENDDDNSNDVNEPVEPYNPAGMAPEPVGAPVGKR